MGTRQTKGRVVESAAFEPTGSVQARTAGITRPWSGLGGGRQGTDPLPALGTSRPLVFEEPKLPRRL
jgi:hypothetical protein